MEKYKKMLLYTKPRGFIVKHLLLKRNDVYWIKTLQSKYQDFQVENITMGLSSFVHIVFFPSFFFTLSSYFNTSLRTLIVVIVDS